MAHIVATSTGFPPHYYTQEEMLAALRKVWADRHPNIGRLERIHRNLLIQGRHLALPLEAYRTPTGFAANNTTWIESALNLGEAILGTLFERARIDAAEISQLTFTTVTGIAVPSIDARLMNRIPFARNLKRMPLFGLGCAGGAAGVARVADYLRGHPEEAAVLLSIELCSLTLQLDDLSIANIISSGLFGDGAAAVLMVGAAHPLARPGQPRVIDSRSVFFPKTEHVMGWDIRDSGFKMILSADVPELAQTSLHPAIETFLAEHRLSIHDIAHWIAHPGGPKVIEALETGLGLNGDAFRLSRESLACVGNVSSASVLLILDQVLAGSQPQPGAYGLMLALGPAFGAELVLLQW
ncbi:MAG TPA: 3-oxoacyl-[acyl-carrier-protein] synthase III C-terminal domain-containing protein [Anaerolineae bacterium]|nr:3-oxoacyl-[acyl-carrier-protein] synthase III C-terminal domain-containing protein [Anaerolineae bacterium]